jgi:hypothetical protein
MRDFLRSVSLFAVCVMGSAALCPLAAQSPVDRQAAESTINIYNLDREARAGGVEIHGPMLPPGPQRDRVRDMAYGWARLAEGEDGIAGESEDDEE